MPTWTLGDVIRRHRKAKGPRWTQIYLGKQCRPTLNKDQITKAETDKSVSLDTLERIATALGTTLDALRSEATAKGDEKSAVRIPNRTRYDQAEPLDNSWTTLTGGVEAEERGMPDDPNFASLKNFWPHLDDGQRAEVVAVAAKIYGHRKRVVGGSPGNE